MSVTYGFYNSVNGDRKYDATQVSSIFDGIIKDGIFMSIGTSLRVKASSGMTVKVGIGRAWFNHTWTYNDAELPLILSESDAINNRIDSVILEINMAESVRENSIKILKGTATSSPKPPSLTTSGTMFQYRLANITVNAGVSEITQANITDLIGTNDTPYITGLLKTINTDDLIAQWESEWEEYIRTQTTNSSEWIANFENELTLWKEMFEKDNSSWCEIKKKNFDIWLEGLKTALGSEDVAGELSIRIDRLTYRQNSTTTFGSNGIITEQTDTVTITTTFNDDGSITEVYDYTNGTKKIAKTIFSNSNVIVTVV